MNPSRLVHSNSDGVMNSVSQRWLANRTKTERDVTTQVTGRAGQRGRRDRLTSDILLIDEYVRDGDLLGLLLQIRLDFVPVRPKV